MKHWETIDTKNVQGFDIVCAVTHEDTHPADCFDESVSDVKEICRLIDAGLLDWFIVRVQAFKDGIELGDAYLGGNLYKRARDFVTESGGYYEDLINEAIEYAQEVTA